MILTHGANSISRGGSHQNEIEIGGRWYPYVQIGNQLWLAENLDYKFEVNGSPLPIGSDIWTMPSIPSAWYYDNNEATYGIDGTYRCGLLYNGYATKYLNNNRATLLPEGWHVPSFDEWNTLISQVGGSSIAGAKLKSINNSITSDWPSNWNGTDDYGFSGLPSGMVSGAFYHIGYDEYLWTNTTGIIPNTLYGIVLSSADSPSIYNAQTLDAAFSIRLVKSVANNN